MYVLILHTTVRGRDVLSIPGTRYVDRGRRAVIPIVRQGKLHPACGRPKP